MEKVFIAAPDYYGVARMWAKEGYDIIKEWEAADIVCYTGGQDINPELYGMSPHPTTSYSPKRDKEEIVSWTESSKQLKVGICRGAQLLCALNGGWLYQDVDRHAGGLHEVLFKESDGSIRVSRVSSAHHQMMRPNPNSQFEDWAVANRATYRDLEKAEHRPVNLKEGYDREIVYWPYTGSLGFQGHPEFGDETCTALFHECVRKALTAAKSLQKVEDAHMKRYGVPLLTTRVTLLKPANFKNPTALKMGHPIFDDIEEAPDDDDAEFDEPREQFNVFEEDLPRNGDDD